MPILKIKKVSKYFFGLLAIDHLDLDIAESEIHGIIGPNGAGKTTLLNVISGFIPPSEGNVIFRDEEITRQPVHQRVRRGITKTFQQTNLFLGATVFDNVCMGYHRNYKVGPTRHFFYSPAARKEQEICNQKSMEILEFMGLSSLKYKLARNLPYGQQRALGVCIALATNPLLLLIDEPTAGMNPDETIKMIELIRRIRDGGVTMLLVEHDMAVITNLCDKVTVLDYGRKIAEGSPEEITNNEKVIEAYLGREEE